jgi:hypothetical protein
VSRRGGDDDANCGASQALLATLDDAGRAKVQFPSTVRRRRWSNLPSGIFKREGLRLGDLTPPQRTAVMTLLAAALSRSGYQKVTAIMHGDEMLRQAPATNGPGSAGAAARQAEDHVRRRRVLPRVCRRALDDSALDAAVRRTSLAINLTLGGSEASMTPSHTAAQPATYTVEGRTVRPLGAENDQAFALINALDGTARSKAILNYRVADLVLGPGQDGRTIQPEGLQATALTAAQQSMLLELIREWAGIVTDAYAEPRLADIKANLSQTYFAWSGPTASGSAAYFRIQGPTLVIEYAPQQGGVDHIHTIYRDPTNDYGAKIAK